MQAVQWSRRRSTESMTDKPKRSEVLLWGGIYPNHKKLWQFPLKKSYILLYRYLGPFGKKILQHKLKSNPACNELSVRCFPWLSANWVSRRRARWAESVKGVGFLCMYIHTYA